MANPARKVKPRKVYESMERDVDFLSATIRKDMVAMRRCLAADPNCIRQVDVDLNNAMHLCILGGAALRAPELMTFLLEETEIDLLHRNNRGFDCLEQAFALNDEKAADMIEPYANKQLNRAAHRERPSLVLVSGGRKPDSEPSP